MLRSLIFVLVFSLGCGIASGRKRRHRKPPKVAAFTADGKPNLQAQAVVIVDLKDGKDYYAKNPDAVRPIASISKLAAALVVLDRGLKLEDVQTITPEDRKQARRGSRSRLQEGLKLRAEDLLHAALMASDNRAVLALGRSVGLDANALARAMTDKAHALGLRHTEFKDPTGLDDGNVSTPREAVRLLQASLATPVLADILKKSRYVVRPVGSRQEIPYQNTDRLIGSKRWTILGGKTGYTDIARYCLVVAARIGGRDVGMAFLGAEGKLTLFGDFNRAVGWLERHRNVAVVTSTAPPQ